MTQPSLFDNPEVGRARPVKKLTIQERFDQWVRDNPKVIEIYLKYAREVRDAGRKRYGIAAITERVRWHLSIQTKGDDFKINNNHRAPMARLLIRLDPTLGDLFEMRSKKKPEGGMGCRKTN